MWDKDEEDSDSQRGTEAGSDKEADDGGNHDSRKTEGLIITILNRITFKELYSFVLSEHWCCSCCAFRTLWVVSSYSA